MKAAILSAPGQAPVYGEFEEPVVEDGQVVLELVAAGIHPVVRSLASGSHYGSHGIWPHIPGVDAVARTQDGELVYTGRVRPPYGTIAERLAVPARMRLTLPAGADPVKVAGGINPGMSSWLPLHARLKETGSLGLVLVIGATGMAGLIAVQNALALGATRVIGAGRSLGGLEQAERFGAQTVALSGDGDGDGDRDADATALAAALGGHAPGLVLDFAWGAPAESAFAALGRTGLEEDEADIAYVQIGARAGAEASLPSTLLRSRRIRISGTGAGAASITDYVAQVPAFIERIATGRVEVPTRTFPLAQVAEAWAAASESGRRVVVVPH